MYLNSCVLLLWALAACSKKTNPGETGTVGGPKYPVITDSIYHPTDPAASASVGFFQDGWVARNFSAPGGDVPGIVATGVATDSLVIDVNKVVTKVVPYMYGNNSNLWSGQMVTQPSLMQYIKDLRPNIIRAPAGSVSDVYFFNGTDAKPRPDDAPLSLVNADGSSGSIGAWYGGNTADWTFSLAHYYDLLAQTNSTGIITVNYGYARYSMAADPVAAAAHLAADWVRYDNGRTKYWEIGNENYGSWEAGYRIDVSKNKDGQPEYITGALYGAHVRVFADSMRAAAREVGATIYIGATLYQQAPASYDYPSIQNWNSGVLGVVGAAADYFIVHNYFTAYNTNSQIADILPTGISVPAAVMSYVKQQVTGAGLPMRPIAMTEWNIQAVGSKQNTSYIAGMHAALTLGSFIKNGFGEASRWDFANGYDGGNDMGMFNNGDEPSVPKWNPRPAFYYMYYFQRCFGDRMVTDTLRRASGNTDITTYSSTFSSGQAGTVIINSGGLSHTVSVDFQHFPAGSKYYWYVLTGGKEAVFSSQVFVNGAAATNTTGGPLNYADIKPYSASLSGTIKVQVPPYSVIYLVADKK